MAYVEVWPEFREYYALWRAGYAHEALHEVIVRGFCPELLDLLVLFTFREEILVGVGG